MARKLDRDHYVLLKNSQVIEDYPEFTELLDTYEDITDEIMATLDPDMQSFLMNVAPSLAQLAEEEWEAEPYPDEDRGENRDEWLLCQLCGTPNRYIFYIHNNYNGRSLNVGSHCITKFTILERQGINVSEYRSRISKVLKRNQLNKVFDGIMGIVEDWDKVLENSPYIITNDISQPYKSLGTTLADKVEYYISGTCKKDEEPGIFSEINGLLAQREPLLAKIQEFIQDSSQKKFPASRAIRIWSRGQSDADTILTWLQEDGEVKQRTAHRITEPGFMKSIASELNIQFSQIGFSNWIPDEYRKGYTVSLKPLASVMLFVPHSNLIKKFGAKLFDADAEGPRATDILGICRVAEDENSHYLLANAIVRKLNNSGFKYYTQDYRFNEIIFHEKSSDQFIIMDLKRLVGKFFPLAYFNSREALQDLLGFIKLPSWKRRSLKEIQEHIKLYDI